MDGRGCGADAVLLAEMVDAGSLEAVRCRVREVGLRRGLADLDLTKFVLVVHELVVNAVHHGGGRADLVLWTEPDGVRCRVSDRGRGVPHRYADARPVDGEIPRWGLRLVRLICVDVRVDTGDHGTRVEVGYPTGGRGAGERSRCAVGF